MTPTQGIAVILSLVAAVTAPRFGATQALSVQDALPRLFTASTLQRAWFTPKMLAVAPVEPTRLIIDGIVAAIGPFQSIAPDRSRFTVTFARGSIQVDTKPDYSGAFAGLFFS